MLLHARLSGRSSIAAAMLCALGCGDPVVSAPVVFELRVSNVTNAPIDSVAGTYEALFSPGWARVDAEAPLFREGDAPDASLQLLAEQGDPVGFASTPGVAFPDGFQVTYEGDPLRAGDQYAVRFEAAVGDELSFVSMFIPSNDVFLGARGIALFDAQGTPVSGDLTSVVGVFDAGSELNQPPGFGDGQPQGGEPGTPEEGAVTRIDGVDAQGHTYPAPASLVRVELVVCPSLDAC